MVTLTKGEERMSMLKDVWNMIPEEQLPYLRLLLRHMAEVEKKEGPRYRPSLTNRDATEHDVEIRL